MDCVKILTVKCGLTGEISQLENVDQVKGCEVKITGIVICKWLS